MTLTKKEIQDLDIKTKGLRCLMSKAFISAGMGHLGGAFSISECIAVLFFKFLRDNPKDWFVLSKGHAGPALYAALVLKGKITEKDLLTLNQPKTIVPSHPDRLKTNGVDCSTGSLGQGLSQAVGIAYGLKKQKKEGCVYCIVGDGECNEGEIWEAFQFASNKKLDNLVIIIDDNQKQVDGRTAIVSCSFNFEQVGTLFGFDTWKINGNSLTELDKVFSSCNDKNGHAKFVIMETVKGFGIDYFATMENCHHVRLDANGKDALERQIKKWEKDINYYASN